MWFHRRRIGILQKNPKKTSKVRSRKKFQYANHDENKLNMIIAGFESKERLVVEKIQNPKKLRRFEA